MGKRSFWAMAAALLVLVVWATLPPHGVSLGRTCRPATLRARISRLVYGDLFWRAQLAALADERDRLLMRLAKPEDEDDTPGGESRMMRLAEGEHSADPEERRRQADATTQRRQDRVAWLVACQMQVEQRLGSH